MFTPMTQITHWHWGAGRSTADPQSVTLNLPPEVLMRFKSSLFRTPSTAAPREKKTVSPHEEISNQTGINVHRNLRLTVDTRPESIDATEELSYFSLLLRWIKLRHCRVNKLPFILNYRFVFIKKQQRFTCDLMFLVTPLYKFLLQYYCIKLCVYSYNAAQFVFLPLLSSGGPDVHRVWPCPAQPA